MLYVYTYFVEFIRNTVTETSKTEKNYVTFVENNVSVVLQSILKITRLYVKIINYL